MATGVATTFDLSTVRKVDIEEMIFTLTPTDVPLIGNSYTPPEGDMGGPQNSILAREETFQVQYDWQEEELLTPRTTLAATAVTADVYVTVASGQRERFATGDVFRIGNEILRVTGYGSTADTITVTRAIAGTAVQHSNGLPVVGVGTALPEGSDPSAHRFRDRTKPYNVTQIFGPHEVKVSRTQEVVSQKGGIYGVSSEMGHQVSNRVKEIAIALEQAVAYGIRVNDTSNEWRTMGGLLYYIQTNVDSTTTDITYALTMDQMQAAWNNGGVVDTLIGGGTQKRKISQWDASLVRLTQGETARGSVVGTIVTDFGTAEYVVDRHFRTQDLVGIDKQYAALMNLRNLVFEPLGQTGDSIKGQCVGEKGFKLRLESRHFRFSALT